jgi:hypothetical protein
VSPSYHCDIDGDMPSVNVDSARQQPAALPTNVIEASELWKLC